MARSKTFRKKRKYKHNNTKKTYKKTYKKRRTMKGGWIGKTLVDGAKNMLKDAAGDQLYGEGKLLAKTQARAGVETIKNGLRASGASPAFVAAVEGRATALATNPAIQKRLFDTLEETGHFLLQQSIRALAKIKLELEEANAQKVKATLDEHIATKAEASYTELVTETEIELDAARTEAAENAAAEKATAEKAALAEKVAAEKAAASATAEKVAAEKAAAAAAAENEAATKVSTLQNDNTASLEKALNEATKKLEELRHNRVIAKKTREQAEKREQELTRRATEEQQKIQVAQQDIQVTRPVIPGIPLNQHTQQAIPIYPYIQQSIQVADKRQPVYPIKPQGNSGIPIDPSKFI